MGLNKVKGVFRMGLHTLRLRALTGLISLATVAFFVTGCGGSIDQNALDGYWMVSGVEVTGTGASRLNTSWEVPESTAYVMSFHGNQLSIPSYGEGLQYLQIPNQGGTYELQDQRITMGSSATPLEVKEVDQEHLILSQTVNTPQDGNLQVDQTLKKVDPALVRRTLLARSEPLPPELQNGYSGNGGPQMGNPGMPQGPNGPQMNGPMNGPQMNGQGGPQMNGPQMSGPQGNGYPDQNPMIPQQGNFQQPRNGQRPGIAPTQPNQNQNFRGAPPQNRGQMAPPGQNQGQQPPNQQQFQGGGYPDQNPGNGNNENPVQGALSSGINPGR